MNSKTTFNATRFDEIDRAVGFAIILVVMGHMFYPELQQGWYAVLRNKIYEFHMPLFFGLSGFLAFLSVSKHVPQSNPEYQDFVGKRVHKFLPPYLLIPPFYWAMEFFLQGLSWQQFKYYVWCWLFAPVHGCPTFIWYLYVLFFFYLITPLLTSRKNMCWIAITVAAPLTFFEMTPWFALDIFAKYSFFFIMGGLLFTHWEQAKRHISQWGWVYLAAFVFVLSCELWTRKAIPYRLWSLISIPAVIYLSMIIPERIGKPVSFLGRSCFAIYLFHTIALNVLYVLKKKCFGDAMPWSVFVVLGFFMGILFPLLVRKIFNAIVPPKVYQL